MSTAQLTQSLQLGSSLVSDAPSYTGSAYQYLEETIVTATTDGEIVFTCDVSAIKAIIILSDQNITFETNAADHAGGNILSLLANVPYVWTYDSYFTNLLTADITKLYITNASGSTATLKILVLTDATP